MKKIFKVFLILLCIFIFIGFWVGVGSFISEFKGDFTKNVDDDAVLEMKLEGVIIDADKFLDDLRKYGRDKKIKGILIRINSPGGVVGPSQEIYSEIVRLREELQKPVVAYASALMASGAYYAAAGADRIVANPGTIVGSIGVIMEFANLEGLYDWAKIKRFVIKTGPYKDSGAEYRPMRDDEREVFQSLIDDVFLQFKDAVQKGRDMDSDVIDKYADGRVFSGQMAKELGFIDQLGDYESAKRLIGELTDLGDEPEIFKPPKKRPSVFELLSAEDSMSWTKQIREQILSLKLSGHVLYLMPGAYGY